MSVCSPCPEQQPLPAEAWLLRGPQAQGPRFALQEGMCVCPGTSRGGVERGCSGGPMRSPHHNQALDRVTRGSRTPEKEAPWCLPQGRVSAQRQAPRAQPAWRPGLAVGGPPLPQKPVSFQQVGGACERGSTEGLWTFAPQHVSWRWGPGPRSTFCIWGSSPERQLRPVLVGSHVGEESYLGGALSAKGLRAIRDRASASLARSLPARWMIHSWCS